MTELQNKKLSKPIEDEDCLFGIMMMYNAFLFGRNFDWASKGLTKEEALDLLVGIANEDPGLDELVNSYEKKYGVVRGEKSLDDIQVLLREIDTQLDGLQEYLIHLRWMLDAEPEQQWMLSIGGCDLVKIRDTMELIRYKHENKEEHSV